jgi:hypothetical protein
MLMPTTHTEQCQELPFVSQLTLALISGGLLTPPALVSPEVWAWGATVIVVIVLLRPRNTSRWTRRHRILAPSLL